MPEQPDAITRPRQAHYVLEDLPETMVFSQRPGDEPREPSPVVEAEQESSAAYRRAAGAVLNREDQ